MDMSQYKDLFISEALEHLQMVNQKLVEMERNPHSSEALEQIFRSAHTIKGMAATMGYTNISQLAHALEDKLDQVRQGEQSVTSTLMDLLFAGADSMSKLIEDVGDIYYLTEEMLLKDLHSRIEAMGLPRPTFIGELNARKLLKGIEESKNRPLHRVIYAIGIRYVGYTTATLIADLVDSIDELIDIPIERLEETPGIGPKIAQSIKQFFTIPENIKVIEKLKAAGVRMKKEEVGGPLKDKIFLFTGALSIPRDEAKNKVEALGGKCVSSVSKKVDYVVVGKDPGSKFDRAKRLGLKIINEKEFLKMIQAR